MKAFSAAGLHPDLLALAAAVRIESPTRYVLLGEARDVLPPPDAGEVEGAGEAGEAGGAGEAPPLVRSLETDIYLRLYTRFHRYAGLAGTGAPDPLGLAQRDHLAALSAANGGSGTWEAGWRIVSLDADGRVAVAKDQVTFWVPPSGLRTASGKVEPGGFCRVRVGKELRNLIPGFYLAIGNGDTGQDRPGPLLRLYWHLTAAAAAPYLAAVTSALNGLGVPFRTKVLADPGAYVRADAGVLYLERSHFATARKALLDVHRAIAPGLRSETPMFTRPLAEGLGAAEDPGNGMSFGQTRCRIAARGLWSAFLAGRESEDGRAGALAEAFAQEGIDPGSLHLEPGSRDVYGLAAQPPAAPRSRARARQPKKRRKGRR